MPNLNSGRIASNRIFYNRGISNNDKTFGAYASINYEILRQFKMYNRLSHRPNFLFF